MFSPYQMIFCGVPCETQTRSTITRTCRKREERREGLEGGERGRRKKSRRW